MSDGAFATALLVGLALVVSVWLCWPRDVPCERIQSIGGDVIALPIGCYVDLTKAREVRR